MARNSLNWFEIPANDIERAGAFYAKVLGEPLFPMEMSPGYPMQMLPGEEGGVGGCIIQGEGYEPTKGGALIYLNANPDLQTMLDRVEEAGGQVLQAKTEIGGDNGYMAYFMDTEGNRVGLHSNN